jgi:hypothetical protein
MVGATFLDVKKKNGNKGLPPSVAPPLRLFIELIKNFFDLTPKLRIQVLFKCFKKYPLG